MDEILLAAAAGLAAGLGVAMPLGAIAALLLREGLVNGFRVAAAGATGIAVVDTAYCGLAALTGAAFAPLVAGHQSLLLVASGILIVGIGLHQLVISLRRRAIEAPTVEPSTPVVAFLKFIGLTAINPMTLVYFVALGGAVTTRSTSWMAPVVFVAAVGLASWAWQLTLAALGSLFGRSVGSRSVETIGIVASLVIIALGVGLLAGAALPCGERPLGLLTDEVGDQCRPTRLVGCAQTLTGVPVEVLTEERVLRPQRPAPLVVRITGTPPFLVCLEQSDETVLQQVRDLRDGVLLPRPGWELDGV